MTKDELLTILKENNFDEIIELIEDAETGDLAELELVESLGLLYDEQLNEEVLRLLQELGVKIIYVTDVDGEEEED
ncbi:hypothetical protein [Ammoniphilus resinae]|uniref:House-cleaning noncanonical NTP pyrophosphatase (MazG superfamily) n=1 Tax=Ammoniphilus resinae TaxID=861532 RepID=A0ABS4GMU9_9BACL|nr:hypothetical protein [Ammoniphilus resinae]MBP1931605.1 putative house-cleaning noncanonical NTP pyrophosphatase (MazG superfamily) [Ammoniphilus resinae]